MAEKPGSAGWRRSIGRGLTYCWAGPNTLIAFVLFGPAALLGGGLQIRRGVIELYGGLVGWVLRNLTVLPGGAAAMTLGHVVIGVDRAALDRAREHEHIHVRQYERWGPLFIPAYLACSAWALLRRRHFYRDNAFEREAYAASDSPRNPGRGMG